MQVCSVRSPLADFGLGPSRASDFDWSEISHPVVLPMLGRETEVGSAMEADICVKVLRGEFTLLTCAQLHTPPGCAWRRLGPFLEAVELSEFECAAEELGGEEEAGMSHTPEVFAPEMEVLQVPLTNRDTVRRGDHAVVYLIKDEVVQLLHIPQHIFRLLAMHSHGHHCDRHFATHVVAYRRKAGSHLLLNSHPIFNESAFALGLVNEPPPDRPPTFEMRLLRLKVSRRRQTEEAWTFWQEFVKEFPEVTDVHCFFHSLADSFPASEEFLATYGPEYHRYYVVLRHVYDCPSTTTLGRQELLATCRPGVPPALRHAWLHTAHTPVPLSPIPIPPYPTGTTTRTTTPHTSPRCGSPSTPSDASTEYRRLGPPTCPHGGMYTCSPSSGKPSANSADHTAVKSAD